VPSFDIVSEIDLQEVRNRVDQTNREASTRFDFKGTDAKIEFSEKELASRPRPRTACARCTNYSKRRWSNVRCRSNLDAGKVEEASHGAARQRCRSKRDLPDMASRSTRWSKKLD